MKSENIESNTDRPRITQSFFKQLTKKISSINRRVLNADLHQDPIEKLEIEALRGSTTERTEAKPVKKTKKKLDLLDLILKSEHKISSNTCILKLPKMPFGKHKDYNEDAPFVIKHFLNTSAELNATQADDLGEITKKFRLNEKKRSSSNRNKTGFAKTRHLKEYEVFNMNHGELKCVKEHNILQGYVNDKERYIKFIYEPQLVEESPKKNISRISQDKSVERLHNSFKQSENQKSSFFKTKYSCLFSRDSNRASNSKIPYLNLNLVNL